MDKALIASYVVEATLEGIPCEVSLLDKDGNEVGFGRMEPLIRLFRSMPVLRQYTPFVTS
jgi:hypothetical protein